MYMNTWQIKLHEQVHTSANAAKSNRCNSLITEEKPSSMMGESYGAVSLALSSVTASIHTQTPAVHDWLDHRRLYTMRQEAESGQSVTRPYLVTSVWDGFLWNLEAESRHCLEDAEQ